MVPSNTVFIGSTEPREKTTTLSYVEPQHLVQYRVLAAAAASVILVPDIAQRWIIAEYENNSPPDHFHPDSRVVRVTAKDARKTPGFLRFKFNAMSRTPEEATFEIGGVAGKVRFRGWQTNTIAVEPLFEAPEGLPRQAVAQTDLPRMFAAILNFAGDQAQISGRARGGESGEPTVVARDPAGHGLLCRQGNKNILFLEGTPAQMGAAHGTLLREPVRKTVERVLYLAGSMDTVQSGNWFISRMSGIEQRTQRHFPAWFVAESDALAAAAGITRRDIRYANLFPERFNGRGIALRGDATVNGQVLHARMLDYPHDLGFQQTAAVIVSMPAGRLQWMSLGYAGLVGTLTAMNEKGLAIGQMGGRDEGQRDGLPRNLLLREVMERAATVTDAMALIRKARRTGEYYCVLSDKTGALRVLHCLPDKITVLSPGQQHPNFPLIPPDALLVADDDGAKELSLRLQYHYGKIDVPKLIEIIKRPEAPAVNLHNAIFAPQTLEAWFADAGRRTPAYKEPYTRVKFNELIQFYRKQISKPEKSE
jgi:hypothetical protein